MTTIRYKGRKRNPKMDAIVKAAHTSEQYTFANAAQAVAEAINNAAQAVDAAAMKPRVAWPKKKQHPRDRLNDQLRTKASRTREVKHLSAAKPREERIAILVDIAHKRGTGVLLTEIETHERKIADLREAVERVSRE